MKRNINIRQSFVDARRWSIDLCRTLHPQSFMGTLVVEDLREVVKAGLLLQEI